MTHTHSKNIRSANNKIVCSGCIKAEDKHGNECFCKCHMLDKQICKQCAQFHRVNGQEVNLA